jgi:hypothetical protein
LLELRPVIAVNGEVETVLRRIVQTVGDAGGVEHDLLGHAADVDAGSAEACGLDDDGFRPVFGGPLCTGQSAAAAADHDQIETLRCHCELRPRMSSLE